MIVARENMHDAVTDVFLRHARLVERQHRAGHERVHVEDERFSRREQKSFDRRPAGAACAHHVARPPGIPRRELEFPEHVFLEGNRGRRAGGDYVFELVRRLARGVLGNSNDTAAEPTPVRRDAKMREQVVAVDEDNNELWVRGGVPGGKNAVVKVRKVGD